MSKNKEYAVTLISADQIFWPTEGENARFIQAHAMPNIGKWNNFEPAKIAKFEKWIHEKPNPQVSNHSTLTSD
ncbi:1881_t:CDS:2 [Funneliformis mosseae]|uniref:1881_t:CDS:1 n=1 Tax=Funneliformis mosseae TaxID=27381 RepID=A0A9N9DRF1_FUNMO|nr:1881_t:CDS:2 [Funneliformis mosseae]